MISAWIGSIIILFITFLYILLALGLPFGEFAMGGKYKIMPKQMRVACGISVIIQTIAILALLQTGKVISLDISLGTAKGVCYFFAIYLTINTLVNAISKSKKEKLVMTPLSLVTAICFWITAING